MSNTNVIETEAHVIEDNTTAEATNKTLFNRKENETMNNETVAPNFYGTTTAAGAAYQQPQQPGFGGYGQQPAYNGYNPYAAYGGVYQPQQAAAGTNTAVFQNNGYTASDYSAYGMPANPGYGMNMNMAPQGMVNYTPASAIRGENPLSDEDRAFIKSNKDLDTLKVTREEDIQGRCMHKKTSGTDKGVIAGGEVPSIPGSWHCTECDASWMITNCPQDDFDKMLSAIWNILQTDKAKMTTCTPGMIEIFRSLPVLKLFSRIHKIAEQDYNKASQAAKSTFTAAPVYGTPLSPTWFNGQNPGLFLSSGMGLNGAGYAQAQQAYAAQQTNPYATAPQQPYPYGAPAAPQQPYPYGAPAAPQQPYPYGAPAAPQQTYPNPYAQAPQQPGCANSPLVSPAAPVANPTATAAPAYQPVQQTGAPDVASTVTTEQKI